MTDLLAQATLTDRAILAADEALAGQRRGLGSLLPIAGPAVMASVAYMDPGNFATNIQAGAKYNYNLLWVVLVANVIAMLLQALSAKFGIVTGRNLAELSRERFPRALVWAMWVVSEIGATEFLGGALGLSLLMGMPLLVGMVITGIATYAILTLQRGGFRPIELLIGGLVGIIGASYLVELFIAPPDWSAVMFHTFVPRLDGGEAVLLAIGIIGATVMPHAIYVHSGFRIASSHEPTASGADCSGSPTARSCWRLASRALSTWRWSPWPLRSSTTACMTMWRRSTPPITL
jgi:manganese transport protein